MLRNEDYTDRELLHLINDCADSDGLATSEEVATALGMTASEGRSAGGRVATRLAWMARYGFLERVDPKEAGVDMDGRHGVLWRISDMGVQIMGGRLAKPVQAALGRMDAGSQVLLMRGLTQRTFSNGRGAAADAVRREYLHQAARRK